MSLDISEVKLFGPVAVAIGGADVGHTDQEGVKVSVKGETVRAMAGKFGTMAVQAWLNGQTVEIEFKLIQSNFANLEKVLPGAVKVTSGGNSKLTFGRGAGYQLAAVTLALSPFPASMDPTYRFTIVRAVPVGDFEISYRGDQFNVWTCKFEGLVNEASGAEGSFGFTFGDPTITGDVTPPSVSSVVPADAAPAVDVDDSVVATISESLDPNTVNAGSVLLVEDPLGTALAVAGTVTLNNAGASTTIVFDPTSPLSALTDYQFILRPGSQPGGIKDLNGNNLPLFASDFTTA